MWKCARGRRVKNITLHLPRYNPNAFTQYSLPPLFSEAHWFGLCGMQVEYTGVMKKQGLWRKEIQVKTVLKLKQKFEKYVWKFKSSKESSKSFWKFKQMFENSKRAFESLNAQKTIWKFKRQFESSNIWKKENDPGLLVSSTIQIALNNKMTLITTVSIAKYLSNRIVYATYFKYIFH